MKKLIFIILMLLCIAAYPQAISYGEISVYHEYGHPDYTYFSGDTIVRTYFGGKEVVYFIDQKVVRHVARLKNKREVRRENKVIEEWNKEREGWYWTGITKCRIDEDKSGYFIDCRKYDRHNPLPEIIISNPNY